MRAHSMFSVHQTHSEGSQEASSRYVQADQHASLVTEFQRCFFTNVADETFLVNRSGEEKGGEGAQEAG